MSHWFFMVEMGRNSTEFLKKVYFRVVEFLKNVKLLHLLSLKNVNSD